MKSCTTLDHIYPAAVPGTPCYCQARRWPGNPKRYQEVEPPVIDAIVIKEGN